MKKTGGMIFAAFVLLCLAKVDASVILNGQEYDITSVAVAYDANWQAQVVADFGADATVADWIDIKADALAETGGVDLLKSLLNTVGGAASLTYNGQQLEGGIYGYFAQVHNGTVPGGWTVIDDIDNNQVDLGIRRCLANAAATKLCSDDVVRLFIRWIDKYDESHFAVIRVLYHNRGATRAFIWDQIHGEEVREDSAEADLFKLLIFDLNTGHVIRQIRDKTIDGRFLAQRRQGGSSRKTVLESAFENTKPYELTELGSQFVHYVMNEVVQQVGFGE